MSLKSWPVKLKQALKTPTNHPPRVAIVGIGDVLRGDEAAGVIAVRTLRPLANDLLLVLDAASTPESITGVLGRFEPDLVLFIDAIEMDTSPGTIRWLDWQAITNLSDPAHNSPLAVIAQYVRVDLGCKIALFGIQPVTLDIGAPLSTPVQCAISTLIAVLSAHFNTKSPLPAISR